MAAALAKILKNTDHLHKHQDVALFAISYISDFDIKLSDQLTEAIISAISSHLHLYSLKDLSYLLVAC
jgi:hypothetical protein